MTHGFRPDIIQFAWVVPNLEEAARRWHASLGVGPFLVNRNLALDAPRHRGNPSSTRFSTAVAQSGEFQIELVEQHDDGPSVYRDTIAPGATGLHHVAMIAADFDAAVAHYTDQGFEIGADGRFGDMRYAYIDTSAALGHMVEIVEDKPAIQAFFAGVRKAAQRWDGDPATLMRELNRG
ncbi:VOC family protein [Sphingosinicella soli]|uniref:VOC domain-containing protein n=1 Tax=Sphingosinicella soli TaxID=333708 RepID=A0A7W7B3K5_9SPHN|nr:VOC family protein [Sphingosinicella soli]MBB4632415.1 hypothetical protein [Sphingosinicella soli]